MSYILSYIKSDGMVGDGPEIGNEIQWSDFCEWAIDLDEYTQVAILAEEGYYTFTEGAGERMERQLTALGRDPDTGTAQVRIVARLLRAIRNRPAGTVAISVEYGAEDNDETDSWIVTDEDADNWSRDQGPEGAD